MPHGSAHELFFDGMKLNPTQYENKHEHSFIGSRSGRRSTTAPIRDSSICHGFIAVTHWSVKTARHLHLSVHSKKGDSKSKIVLVLRKKFVKLWLIRPTYTQNSSTLYLPLLTGSFKVTAVCLHPRWQSEVHFRYFSVKLDNFFSLCNTVAAAAEEGNPRRERDAPQNQKTNEMQPPKFVINNLWMNTAVLFYKGSRDYDIWYFSICSRLLRASIVSRPFGNCWPCAANDNAAWKFKV